MNHRVVIFARLLAGFLFFLFLPALALSAEQRFRLVSYNVENLFDLTRNGSEYTGYIPHTGYGWDEGMARVKYANIASVLVETGAHVAVLSEVESREALERLQGALRKAGYPMDHGAIAKRATTVRYAVLSRFPVTRVREVPTGSHGRSILRVTLDIHDQPLTVYANHWKSKRGPESERLACARALVADIGTLPAGTDYILAGDFNSDYNEWQTIHGEPALNDTSGKTGINHVLKTILGDRMVRESDLAVEGGLHYDLWMELPAGQRWSHGFGARKGSLDHILLPAALYDGRGISYVDGSYDRFAPEYLFRKGWIYRWQRAGKGQGKHLGHGYSDHLPVYADFTVGPFVAAGGETPASEGLTKEGAREDRSVADLYNLPPGPANYRIRGVVVLYKADSHVVVKDPHGRAIHFYKAGEGLESGWVVDVTVKGLHDHYGLREVTAVSDVVKRGEADPGSYDLTVDDKMDLSDRHRVSEVVAEVFGLYRDGWLHYGGGRSVRVYTAKGIKRPKNGTRICLTRVRIGFHKSTELVVESQGQMKEEGR